jgi:hypothetical protein
VCVCERERERERERRMKVFKSIFLVPLGDSVAIMLRLYESNDAVWTPRLQLDRKIIGIR